LFAVYAFYVWWQLIHDQTTAVTRRVLPSAAAGPDSADGPRQPGWALTGGRRKNVAIAADSAVDDEGAARHDRFAPQTPEEAAELARYNRYLAELNAADAGTQPR